MPEFRVIGFYNDNMQIYGGDAEGDDVDSAVCGLRDAMYDTERDNLMVIAVLDEQGSNCHGSDKAFPITEWEEQP